MNIKQEMHDISVQKQHNTRKERNDDEEESTDSEHSVIILESDTEAETEKSESNEDEDSVENSSSSSNEDDEEESESESSDDDDDDDDDSDSVWSTIDEATEENITSEAAEAKIIKTLEKSIIAIADKKTEKGQNILRKLLKNPIISVYHKSNVNFEEIEEPQRLSKMLQVFIACHKNLAQLPNSNSIKHFLQVLSYQPNNTAIWFETAMKSVENGDLEFAKYSFSKCENEKTSIEAHSTILYLCCEYKACLTLLKNYEKDVGELNDKMKFLKWKIRNTSNYYKKISDSIFEEDDFYTELKDLDQKKISVFDNRLNELKNKIDQKRAENESKFEEKLAKNPIKVHIYAEQNLATICTIFCDLFDRIQAYSNIATQELHFVHWENRQDFLDIKESVYEMLDVVELLEEMTENVAKKKKNPKKKTKEYLASWKKRLFVDKPIRSFQNETRESSPTDEYDDKEENDEDTETEQVSSPKSQNYPGNELTESFGLFCSSFEPIKTTFNKKEKTPPPTFKTYMDEEEIVNNLRKTFANKTSCTIAEVLKTTLLQIGNSSPKFGALTESFHPIFLEMYTRLGYIFDLCYNPKFNNLNIIGMELGHPKALDNCLKRYVSVWYNDEDENEDSDEEMNDESWSPSAVNIQKIKKYQNDLKLRFAWKYSNLDLSDSNKLEYLYMLKEVLQNDDLVKTSTGSFRKDDVEILIEQLEKKIRIKSVKELWTNKSYLNLIEIIQNDIDFSIIDEEEIIELLEYWLKSLEKLKKYEKLAIVVVRVFHFYLFSMNEKCPEKLLQDLIEKLNIINFKKLDISLLSSIGYFVCLSLKKYQLIEQNWKNWKCLYEIVKAMKDIPPLEYLSTLDKNGDVHAMPSLDLDVLVKAHEILGEAQKCTVNEYEFILFILDACQEIIDDIPLLEAIFEKENLWLWSNLNQEISQCLYCLFGKYGKKRRMTEDHGSECGGCKVDEKLAKRILRVILIQPLPLYDDKERLSHDVIDLINLKFDFLLKISDEKASNVTHFNEILASSAYSNLEEFEKELKKAKKSEEDNIQCLVWYAMALNSYRQSSHLDARKYSELFLTSQDSFYDPRLGASAWAILAHEHVHELFQLENGLIFHEWRWRIIPFKMAIRCQKKEAVMHFQVAVTIYQLATSLERFLRELPRDDWRRKRIKDSQQLRKEAKEHFEKCLSLAQPLDDGTPPEYQWLCYFFLGKLEAKEVNIDIVKVVECFYEAACGCQLVGFYYPLKVNTKKQTNFEPLEVHYQVHSVVWKYLQSTENPSLEILKKLLSYLKTFAYGHRVVKTSYSMFEKPPEIYEIMMQLTDKTVDISNDVEQIIDETIYKIEMIEQLEEMCFKAFGLISERFPHIKAHYRLAEYWLRKEMPENAVDHILKHVFRRKKRDDGIFDNIVEIACSDINRVGSFCFHVYRCLQLAISLAAKFKDLHNLVSILISMITTVAFDDDQFIEIRHHTPVIRILLATIKCICEEHKTPRSTPSPVNGTSGEKEQKGKKSNLTTTVIRNELWRLWGSILKQEQRKENKLLMLIEKNVELLINKLFESVEKLKSRMSIAKDQETRKKATLKRNAQFDFMPSIEPSLKQAATTSRITIGKQTSSNNDVQMISAKKSKIHSNQPSTSSNVNPTTNLFLNQVNAQQQLAILRNQMAAQQAANAMQLTPEAFAQVLSLFLKSTKKT